jgi:hypothetical protein
LDAGCLVYWSHEHSRRLHFVLALDSGRRPARALFFRPVESVTASLARTVLLSVPGQGGRCMTVMTRAAIATSTGTVTVNAAFLQEIKEVNQELWHLLSDLAHRCQRPIAPSHCRVLIDKLSQLRDQLALHFSLEEAYGYFEDPVDVAPQLGRQAEKLRGEHKDLYLELCDLVEHAERLFYDDQHAALALWIGPEFLQFERRLRRHEERENELIMDAYDGDIGVGD